MDTALLKPLNNLESSLNTLVHSLTTTNTFSAAPGAARDLVSADEALVSALQTLKTHQDNYQRILQLRAEADRLNEQLKNIVRTCIDFRTEIGNIHPSILNDSDDEDEDQSGSNAPKDVDYETLLSFAARIGKHNALASRAAEQESTRRIIEARRKREQAKGPKSQNDVNGGLTQTSTETDNMNENNNLTEESQAHLTAIDGDLAAQRAYMGQAFPAADRLRMGALGQLQLLRERSGEDAVDREIERMIKESELGISTAPATQEAVGTESGIPGLEDTMRTDKRPSESAVTTGRPVQQQQRPSQSQQPPAPPKKKVLDLDFPGSDDEDDE